MPKNEVNQATIRRFEMSLHRKPDRPYWYCAYTAFDPETGTSKRVFRTTKTTNKKQAQEICRAWQKAATLARYGKLSQDAARSIIAQGVADIFLAANAEALPSNTIEGWGKRWLESKRIEAGESTHARYKRIVERFTDFLGDAQSKRDLEMLQRSDIAAFRDAQAKELSVATANLSVKVLRVCLGEAVHQGLIASNPAAGVKIIKTTAESRRRPFTIDEIKRILAVCDVEWRGLVLFGLYLGQRLGDLRMLTWRAVNLETGEVAFTTHKTGRRVILPLVQPLIDYLSELPDVSDNPNAHIFPNAAKYERTTSLSNQFYEILVEAGLAEPRPDYYNMSEKDKKGRDAARDTGQISFHSLRHTATTMLKNAGVSLPLAMAIIGHESEAVSRQYTHHSTDDLRRAMAKLPDVSATTTKAKRTKKA